MMRHLDLFSGIGGFALAARWVGWETVAFCEIEPYCIKVLNKHWPEVPVYGDIRQITAERLRADRINPNIITAGFPCQDFSRLGKRSGLEGEHSGLWSELFCIICEIRPQYVVLENVPEILVHGMGRVIGDLASIGYDTEWEGIPAAAIGANHLRARQWILAYTPGIGNRSQEETILSGRLAFECGDWWASEPGVCRVDDGVPARVDRLRCLGNAIVPQIAEIIFRTIENGRYTGLDQLVQTDAGQFDGSACHALDRKPHQ